MILLLRRLMQTTSGDDSTDGATGDEAITDAASALSASDFEQWIRAAVVIAASVVLARIVRLVLRRVLNGGRTDSLLGDLVGRLVSYVVVSFGVVYGLDELGVAIGPLLGALGVVGLALAFAMQSLLENFVAGVLLQVRRPFERGDEISCLDHTGRVVAIDSRTMTLVTPDDEMVRLPNAAVISAPIVNLTRQGRRRTRLDVGVAYGTDLDTACSAALAAVTSVAGVLESPPPAVRALGFGDSSIDLAVFFWHEPQIATEWSVRHHAVLAIDEAFGRAGVVIPFPQRVVHLPDRPSADHFDR
ncbi:MAG: mechanosensitive ion channel family protein [Acidimicrobiales bacterium]